MAVKLNLLPEGFALTGPLGQVVKVVRSLNVILLALFLVMVIGMGGFFIFSSISLNNLNTANKNLENQIDAQSTAQQQIVLLKDRLGQIKTVQGTPGATKNFNNVSPLINLVTGDSLLSEIDIDPQKVNFSVIFKSNSDLTNFLKNLYSSKVYNSVSLATFNYSSAGGYQTGLDFLMK